MIFVWILMVSFIGVLAPWVIKLFFMKKLDLSYVFICSIPALIFPAMIVGASTMGQFSDTEILNGQVISKESRHVSCIHSYDCNCHMVTDYSTDSKGRRYASGSHEHCDTCYEHPWDVGWFVYSSVGSFRIPKVDYRGFATPPRWDIVKIGEPASAEHSYVNYIKGDASTLFHLVPLKVQFQYPTYPTVYDFWHINRVINLGNAVDAIFAKDLNDNLNLTLRTLGAKRQVNVVVIFTTNKDPMFGEGLRRAWENGKKNDVVVVIGVDQGKPSWVKAFSLAQSDMINIKLRDDIEELTAFDNPVTFSSMITDDIEAEFKRKHMHDFEYLKWDAKIPTWIMVIAFLLSSIIGIGGPILLGRTPNYY